MATERQVQETIARCVALMVFHHNCERSQEARDRMIAEVQIIAGFVEELGFSRSGVDWRIMRPIEAELLARYGHEVGPRLFAMFADAFEDSFEAADRPA
jgi:hypothetical protein